MNTLSVILIFVLIGMLTYIFLISSDLSKAQAQLREWSILVVSQAAIIQQYQKELKKYRHENKEVVSDDTGGAPEGVERPIR